MENLIKLLKERNAALAKDRTLSALGRAGRIAENKRIIKLLEAGGYEEAPEAIEAIEAKTDNYSDYLRNN